jgi:hypothetical protein
VQEKKNTGWIRLITMLPIEATVQPCKPSMTGGKMVEYRKKEEKISVSTSQKALLFSTLAAGITQKRCT